MSAPASPPAASYAAPPTPPTATVYAAPPPPPPTSVPAGTFQAAPSGPKVGKIKGGDPNCAHNWAGKWTAMDMITCCCFFPWNLCFCNPFDDVRCAKCGAKAKKAKH